MLYIYRDNCARHIILFIIAKNMQASKTPFSSAPTSRAIEVNNHNQITRLIADKEASNLD